MNSSTKNSPPSHSAAEAATKPPGGGEVVAASPAVTPAYDASQLASLPDTLDFMGEFGTEILLFLPFCVWLSKAGLLKSRRIRTFRGMRCFYDDLDCLEIIEKDDKRAFTNEKKRPAWWPVKNEFELAEFGPSPFFFYADWRTKFRKRILLANLGAFNRPLLVIHNKYNVEWSSGPVNAISLRTLETIFLELQDKFALIYIRHGMKKLEGFSEDHNEALPFADAELLERFPKVFSFDQLFETYQRKGGQEELNCFKCAIYSHCYHFISTQGGGSHQVNMFPGSLLTVLHRAGREEHGAYSAGYYGYVSRIPPVLAVCRTEEELLRALSLYNDTAVAQGRVFLSAASLPVLNALSPATIGRRKADLPPAPQAGSEGASA